MVLPQRVSNKRERPCCGTITSGSSGGLVHQQQQQQCKLLVVWLVGFLLGCILSASILLGIQVNVIHVGPSSTSFFQPSSLSTTTATSVRRKTISLPVKNDNTDPAFTDSTIPAESASLMNTSTPSVLDGIKILVAIASYDFSQIPHLEEVLDGYFDLCAAGAHVDVVIHSTMAYPVTLIDLFNTRFTCQNPSPRSGFTLTIVLKPSSLRLHLVDCHRTLFYDKLDQYDLFIYTEDDIRVSPRTVAAYLLETRNIETLVGKDKASNFNVGIARYEYNFPSNVVIDDKTRHATQNVTRVYWEHSRINSPIIPDAVNIVSQEPFLSLQHYYVHMTNHHQGMYLATRELLKAWRDRPNCHFDQVRDRPGKGSQPSEGTQRVWMSSQMLFGGRHCHVQQVIPINRFGLFTVLHLPNKNYRRVGRYRNRTFRDGTEQFEPSHPSLLTAMQLHIAMRQSWPDAAASSTSSSGQPLPYRGIQMIDQVDDPKCRTPLLERRMAEYHAYVKRGGIMSLDDMTKTNLIELQ